MNYLPVSDTDCDLLRAALDRFASDSAGLDDVTHPATSLAAEIDARTTRTREERWTLHRALGMGAGHHPPTIPEATAAALELMEGHDDVTTAYNDAVDALDQIRGDLANVRRVLCPDLATADPVNGCTPIVDAQIVEPLDEVDPVERRMIAEALRFVADDIDRGRPATQLATEYRDLANRADPQLVNLAAPAEPDTPPRSDLVAWATTIIANVDSGAPDWPNQADDWREAADRWLEAVHDHDPIRDLSPADRRVIAVACRLAAANSSDDAEESEYRGIVHRAADHDQSTLAAGPVDVLAGDLLPGHIIDVARFPFTFVVATVQAAHDHPGQVDVHAVRADGTAFPVPVYSVDLRWPALTRVTVYGMAPIPT